LTVNRSDSRKKSIKDHHVEEVSPKIKGQLSRQKKSKEMKNSVLFGKSKEQHQHEFSVKKPITA